MDSAQRYGICSPGVIAENFGGDVVIVNLEEGCYYSLHGAGSPIWTALTGGATPQAILDGALRDRPVLVESTSAFVDRLLELQLIRPVAATVADTPPAVDWNATNFDPPSVEVFDDLAEVILADSIHDVDVDAGWPARKAA